MNRRSLIAGATAAFAGLFRRRPPPPNDFDAVLWMPGMGLSQLKPGTFYYVSPGETIGSVAVSEPREST